MSEWCVVLMLHLLYLLSSWPFILPHPPPLTPLTPVCLTQAAVPQAVNQALQHTFSSLVLPAIERATKEMFQQVDSSLKEGLAAHRSALQQQQAQQQAAAEQLLTQQAQAQAQAVQQQVQQLLQPVVAALPDLSAKVQVSHAVRRFCVFWYQQYCNAPLQAACHPSGQSPCRSRRLRRRAICTYIPC